MVVFLISLAVLGLGALLSLVLHRSTRGALVGALGAVVVGGGLFTTVGLRALLGGVGENNTVSWPLPLGAMTLALDGLSAWFLVVIGVVSVAVAIYSWSYMLGEVEHSGHGTEADENRPGSIGVFGALLCVLVGAMGVVVTAANVMGFLVGWELVSLAAFFLVLFHDRKEEVRRGAWMYLIATHLGTALFLLPMFTVLVTLGGWDFTTIGQALKTAAPGTLVMIFVLGLVGFGTKAGFMPMHVWLPNAHPVAPTPVSALLSAVVIKVGIYGLMRMLSWMPPLPVGCGTTLLVVGGISGVMGVLYALAQHDIKRMLAYSSVENVGIIALGMGVGMLGQATGQPLVATLGYTGAMLHVLNHALFKGLLFMSAGAVIHATGTGEMDRLGGLMKKMPANGLLFFVGTLAICALPPLNGFMGEWAIYGGLLGGAMEMPTGQAALAVTGATALALIGGLALAVFSKVFSIVFLGEPRTEAAKHVHKTPRMMVAGMAMLAVLCLAAGLAPALIVPLAGGAVKVVTGVIVSTGTVLSPMVSLSVVGGLFVFLLAALFVIRSRGGSANSHVVKNVSTWGCGYPFASARIQYTGSSYSWTLVSTFRRFLWPNRKVVRPVGIFPQPSQLLTRTPDLAESDVYTPVFRGTERLALMATTLTWQGVAISENPPPKPVPLSPDMTDFNEAERRLGPLKTVSEGVLSAMRRGSIQVCLAYIVIVLVVVLLVEAMMSPLSSKADPQSPTTSPTPHMPLHEPNGGSH